MIGVLALCLWLILIPFLTGLLFSELLPLHRRTVAVVCISGLLIQFSVFFVIGLPCMLTNLYIPFYNTSRIFSIVMYVLAVCGLVVLLRRLFAKETHFGQGKALAFARVFPGEHHPEPEALMDPHADISGYRQRYDRESFCYWLLFAVLLGFQLSMAYTNSFFDGDDSYYVVQSLTAQKFGRMYTVIPYTGETTVHDTRHALAMLPIWEAFLADRAGVHATIMAHTMLPFFFLPFGYLVYSQIGRSLFRGRQKLLPIFMCVLCFLQVFGNISIYTAETFFITRTAQGKAAMAAIVIPLVFWIFMWLFEENGALGRGKRAAYAPWVLLALINLFAGLCTSIGVMLSGGLIALLSAALVCYTKNIRLLIPAILSCIPNVLYILVYLYLT